MAQQFQVPQFIDIEPKLLGPLTVKQSIILGLAGVFLFVLYFYLEMFLFVLIAVVLGVFAMALAFIKINGRPLLNFIGSAFSYFLNPKLYIWTTKKIKEKQISPAEKKKRRRAKREKEGVGEQKITPEQIKKLAEELDTK